MAQQQLVGVANTWAWWCRKMPPLQCTKTPLTVASRRRVSSMKGSSATPCHAKRFPLMSTAKCLG